MITRLEILLAVSLLLALGSSSHGLGSQSAYEYCNTSYMLNRTNVVEHGKGYEQCCGLSGCTGDRHRQCTKVFRNGSGTRRSKETHRRKENHHGNLLPGRPRTFFDRSVIEILLVSSWL